jgi:uncharacterized protein YndB with AHSA1/START domain
MTIIAVVVVVLLAALLVFAATKPDTVDVQRVTNIKAPPDRIFALIDDFHRWGTWSPYEKRDPIMKKTFSGAAHGAGAVYEWEGNSKVGKGRMEITRAVPASRVSIKLDFIKPMEGHNVAEFTLEPKGDSTTSVTWAMHGPASFMSKVMQVFVSMDSLVGKDFETGLANLKSVAEQ